MAAFRVGSGHRIRVPAVRPSCLPPGLYVPPSPLPPLGESLANAVCVMPCEAGAAARSRAAAQEVLGDWAAAVPERLGWDVVAVVSELAANAARHGLSRTSVEPPWRIVLGLMLTHSHLMCVVSDPGRDALRLCALDQAAESGRGLHIVDAAAQSWGWYPGDAGAGKVVWAVFPVTGCPAPR